MHGLFGCRMVLTLFTIFGSAMTLNIRQNGIYRDAHIRPEMCELTEKWQYGEVLLLMDMNAYHSYTHAPRTHDPDNRSDKTIH